MERLKQQLSVARKQRERLQLGYAAANEDEGHQQQDAFSQQLSLDRKQRERLQQVYTTSAEDEGHQQPYAFSSKKNRNTKAKDNTMRFFLGMTVLVVSVMIAWWGISRQQVSEIQLSTSPLPDPPQMSATRSRAIDKLDVRITGLVQRIESLTDSITFLESKLMSAHLITDSILDAEKQLASTTMTERELMANKAEQMHGMPVPSAADSIEPAEQQLMAEAEQILEMSPPAAGHSAGEAGAVTTHGQPSDGTMHTDPISASALHDAPDTMLSEPPAPDTDTVGNQQASNQTLVAMTRQVEVLEPEDPVSHQQPVASLDSKKGPWVINLVSTPSKSEADGLANKAESRDIETELEQVTVKGTDYWRVQITGFATADEARSYGDIAMEKLGMKDVWIMKH